MGVQAGALFIPENPALFWGLVASMYIGNVVLLVLNLPLVPLFAQVLRAPAYVLYPAILGIAVVGVYSDLGKPVRRLAAAPASACSDTSCASSTIPRRR